jgi:hypothetical protein
LGANPEVISAVKNNETLISSEVLAKEISYSGKVSSENELGLEIEVTKA